jgi:hypothetical protein
MRSNDFVPSAILKEPGNVYKKNLKKILCHDVRSGKRGNSMGVIIL